jgi:hypothetical protein
MVAGSGMAPGSATEPHLAIQLTDPPERRLVPTTALPILLALSGIGPHTVVADGRSLLT